MEAPRKINEIDYLKGFSICTIVLMHLFTMIWQLPASIRILASVGGTGVHVFFLCSGIGLYLSYRRHEVSFTTFLKKRFGRIYLPYILVVVVSFFLPWLYEGSDRVAALLSHVFLFKMFVPEYMGSFGAHFWFVSTMIQLYLLFIPMCMLKKRMKNNAVFAGVFLMVSIVWWILCLILPMADDRVWGSFCFQYIWEFALGFVVADYLHEEKKRQVPIWLLGLTAVIGIGLQGVMALRGDALQILNDIPGLLGYTALALLLGKLPPIHWVCKQVAKFSYELYLVHMGIFVSFFVLINPLTLERQTQVAAVALVVSLVVAYGYHGVIEFIRRRCIARGE